MATVETNGFNSRKDSTSGSTLPFLLGTAVGVSAGVVAGALCARYGLQLVSATVGVFDRRTDRHDGERPRFDLLLQ